MFRGSCFQAVALLVSCSGNLYAQSENGLEFKAKILTEWNSVLETIKTAQWEQKIEYCSSLDPKNIQVTRTDVIRAAFNRNAGFLWLEDVENSGENNQVTMRGDLNITNPKYTAEMRRPKGGGAGWVLTKFDDQDNKIVERFRCPWMLAGNVLLSRWLPDASFVISRMEELPRRPGSHLRRVHFVNELSQRQFPDTPEHIQSGYIDFDTAHSYRPVSYEHLLKNKVIISGVMRGTFEYEDGDAIPILKTITSEEEARLERKGTISGKEIHSYSKFIYNGVIRDEEFRLSSYGLPEPIGVEWKKPTPTYVWLLIGAGVSSAFAVGFRYLGRRRNTAS